jgi:hypothetical protein
VVFQNQRKQRKQREQRKGKSDTNNRKTFPESFPSPNKELPWKPTLQPFRETKGALWLASSWDKLKTGNAHTQLLPFCNCLQAVSWRSCKQVSCRVMSCIHSDLHSASTHIYTRVSQCAQHVDVWSRGNSGLGQVETRGFSFSLTPACMHVCRQRVHEKFNWNFNVSIINRNI